MRIAGFDIGGTKVELQVFDADWQVLWRERIETPSDYSDLLQGVSELIDLAETATGPVDAIGVGSAGLIHPKTAIALTANLTATGHPFVKDIEQTIGRGVTYLNDCRALALSEALLGAGQGHQRVAAVVLGTGVGGGIAIDGHLVSGPTATGGEFGHQSAPADLVVKHDLPILKCGCGRTGCIETLISGPGLSRLAQHFTGRDLSPQEIVRDRKGEQTKAWRVWCDLTAELLQRLIVTLDPDIIVLGGGLSTIEGLIPELSQSVEAAQIAGFGIPPLQLAQGGPSSGARGAALAAWQSLSKAKEGRNGR